MEFSIFRVHFPLPRFPSAKEETFLRKRTDSMSPVFFGADLCFGGSNSGFSAEIRPDFSRHFPLNYPKSIISTLQSKTQQSVFFYEASKYPPVLFRIHYLIYTIFLQHHHRFQHQILIAIYHIPCYYKVSWCRLLSPDYKALNLNSTYL